MYVAIYSIYLKRTRFTDKLVLTISGNNREHRSPLKVACTKYKNAAECGYLGPLFLLQLCLLMSSLHKINHQTPFAMASQDDLLRHRKPVAGE